MTPVDRDALSPRERLFEISRQFERRATKAVDNAKEAAEETARYLNQASDNRAKAAEYRAAAEALPIERNADGESVKVVDGDQFLGRKITLD